MSDTPISPTTGKPIPKSGTYEGSCHCGRVQYTMKISPPIEDGPVTSCNCSICSIHSHLMVYPLKSNMNWTSGADDMTSYTFNKERIEWKFCSVCGTSMSGESTDPNFFADNRAVNIRTVKNLDLDKLTLRKVDGRSM